MQLEVDALAVLKLLCPRLQHERNGWKKFQFKFVPTDMPTREKKSLKCLFNIEAQI